MKDDAVFRRKSGPAITGAEFKQRFGVDGIVYHHQQPCFEDFYENNDIVGTVVLKDGISVDRKVTHEQARKILADRNNTTVSEITDYMKKHDLVFHELIDGKTVVVIPAWLNIIFSHTGGTARQATILALSRLIKNGKVVLQRYPEQKIIVDKEILSQCIKQQKELIKAIKKELKNRG